MTFNPVGQRGGGAFLALFMIFAQGIHAQEAVATADPMAGSSTAPAAVATPNVEADGSTNGVNAPSSEVVASAVDSTAPQLPVS